MAQSSYNSGPAQRDPAERAHPAKQPAGWFMGAFLVASLVLSALNPALFESPAASLVDGSWAAAYQAAFDEASPLLEPAKTTWGVIEYALFRQGRPGVLIGSDDWLFTTEEFDHPQEPSPVLESNLDFIARSRDVLARSGTELVVALLPAKARIYEEKLGRYEFVPVAGPLYSRALNGLRQRGIPAPDLESVLAQARGQDHVFLRTDTHWTPFGAMVVAKEVARSARELAPGLGDQEFETETLGAEMHRGDLTTFLPLGSLYDQLGPADDRLHIVDTRPLDGPGSDLFAEVSIPVTLIGTSYSEDERWNFPGALREALGSDVLVAARQGQGPFEPMNDYLSSEALRSTPPDLVIWEVPERYLTEEWQQREETE